MTKPQPVGAGLQPLTISIKEIVMAHGSLTVKGRFVSKVEVITESGCWVWMGSTNNRGYGMFSVKNRPNLAHRISYELFNGPINQGMCVLHMCDVTACVNPAHLIIGTLKDNSQDMIKKGRANYAIGLSPSKETRQKMSLSLSGANNPNFGKHGENNPLFRRARPEEVKRKISETKLRKRQGGVR